MKMTVAELETVSQLQTISMFLEKNDHYNIHFHQ